MFDTLRYARKLEGVGLSREQAEVHLQIITEIIETDVATKQDFLEFKRDVLQLIEQKMGTYDYKLQNLEHRMTIKFGAMLGTMFALAISAIAVLIRLH